MCSWTLTCVLWFAQSGAKSQGEGTELAWFCSRDCKLPDTSLWGSWPTVLLVLVTASLLPGTFGKQASSWGRGSKSLFQALMRSDIMTQCTVSLCQTSAHFSQCCSLRRPPCSGDHSCHTCPSLFSALTLPSLFKVNFAVFRTTSFYRFVTHISTHALKIRLFQPKARPAGSAPESTT